MPPLTMESIWNKLYAQLNQSGIQGFEKIYRALRTDEERVVFTWKLLQGYNIVPPAMGDAKNAYLAELLREEGNKIYTSTPRTSESCLQAFKLYGQSIAYAPDMSKELALAYANRSAVLCEMKKYLECILDIDRALSIDYPDALRSKLYLRKAKCAAASNAYTTEELLKEVESWMDKMSINDSNRTKFNQKIASIMKSAKTDMVINRECQTVTRTLRASLPIIQNRNPEVPCASNAVTINYDKRFGRHIVATRNIEPGEILVVEKPFSAILDPKNAQTHCYYCLEVCWATIPCKHCVIAMYCSERCRAADWNSCHDIECPILDHLLKLDFSKLDLHTIRLTIDAIRRLGSFEKLRAEVKAVEMQTDNRTRGFSDDGIYRSTEYRTVYSLATNTSLRNPHDLFRRSLDTCAILYFLLNYTHLFGLPGQLDNNLNNPDVRFIGGLLMRHQQSVPTNGHTIGEERGMEHGARGIAVMPFLSLMNHSCNNNATRWSVAKHIVLYAQFPIEAGEQIFDNYGALFPMLPKVGRQQQLMRQFYFTCTCAACRNDWPLYGNIMSYECIVNNAYMRKKIAKAVSKLPHYYMAAHTISGILSEPNMKNDLVNMISILSKHVSSPCLELIDAVETLKRIIDVSGNRLDIPTI